MEFIIDLFKKLLKIFALYILIGFVAVLLISVSGGVENLLLKETLGNMSTSDYILLMGYAEILWLPLIAGMVFSKVTYINIPGCRIIFVSLMVAFLVGTIAIASKE